MMAGLKDALGNVFLGLASSLRSKGRPVGLMRLTGSGYGQRCNINPYHIYVVMSHRSRDNENYSAPPNTDICLSATSMTVVEGVSEVVETLRLKWGIPFVSVRNADVDGEYWLNGVNVAQMEDDELSDHRLKNLGFVFQSFHLIPQLTVLENIEMPMFYLGVPQAERTRRAKVLAERVEMDHRLTSTRRPPCRSCSSSRSSTSRARP